MSVNIEQVKLTVRAAIEPPHQPTKAQIAEICELTYLGDSRKEIQRMIDRRLKSPDSYGSLEVFHTLTLMQSCLSDASSDFVNFCIDKVQHVIDLKHFQGNGTPAEWASVALVRSKANTLAMFLLDSVRLTDKKTSSSVVNTPMRVPPPVLSRTIPLPSPLSTPMTQKKSPASKGNYPPTPGPTPPKSHPRLKPDDSVTPEVLPSRRDMIPHASVLLLKKEDVAMMTFRSGKDGLDGIFDALDDLLKSQLSVNRTPDELVKALTCVHHCLFWGSAPFVARCRERKSFFNKLCNHSIAQVRGHADAVVTLLSERSRLQEERQSRLTLMPPPTPYKGPTLDESNSTAPGRIKVLEPVTDISKYVAKTETEPFAGGGYSDVWKGVYRTSSGTEIVAIKCLRRLSKIPPERLQKHLNRELRVWRTLLHKNVSPFYGVTVEAHIVGMVSPFYSKGSVLDYVKLNPKVNSLEMLQGIADGVAYLHARVVVHGDIKCANVMVDDEGTPKLIDFGLAQMIDEHAETTGYTTSSLGSSLRWSAPELLIHDSMDSPKGEKSDVYAFASTCVEVGEPRVFSNFTTLGPKIMTLKPPYQGLKDPQVMKHVITDEGIPERPTMEDRSSPCDELWEFLKTCWRKRPEDRPNIVAVQRKLAEFYDGVVYNAATPTRFMRLRN